MFKVLNESMYKVALGHQKVMQSVELQEKDL